MRIVVLYTAPPVPIVGSSQTVHLLLAGFFSRGRMPKAKSEETHPEAWCGLEMEKRLLIPCGFQMFPHVSSGCWFARQSFGLDYFFFSFARQGFGIGSFWAFGRRGVWHLEFWARPFLLAPQAAKKSKAKPAAKPAAAPAKAEPEAAPADAVRAESTGSHAGPPTRPVLPSEDFVGDAAPIITKIVEWTKPQLQKLAADNGWLKPSETLEGLGPLPFAPSGADRSTYKESFHMANCAKSLRAERLYEAGGSIHWLHMLPNSSYAQVWWPEVMAANLLRAVPVPGAGGRCRMLWPMTMEAYVAPENIPDEASGWPCGLQLLHGHSLVWAWWCQVYKCVVDTDLEALRLLWESALTATVLIRVLAGPAEVAAVPGCGTFFGQAFGRTAPVPIFVQVLGPMSTFVSRAGS